MALSGMALREAVANAPTIHELADALEEVVFRTQSDDSIAKALELIRSARAVPKQPLDLNRNQKRK